MATLTNVGSNRFYSNANGGFCLLPTESLEILDDSLDTSGIIKLYKPKKKVSLSKSLPKKLKKVEE